MMVCANANSALARTVDRQRLAARVQGQRIALLYPLCEGLAQLWVRLRWLGNWPVRPGCY